MSPAPPLLTVVSNVHNDPERLPRAVASVLRDWPDQSLEVLVVDDGSTDETPQVARDLAAADDRVRVVRREDNDGTPGAARNLGIDSALGDYVAFLDSDDEYLPGGLRRLLERALETGADVVAGAISRFNPRTGVTTPLPATAYTSAAAGPLTGDSPLWLDTVAVAKVMRRSLLDAHGIRFPEGILYEDQPYTVALWLNASSVATLDEVVYHWYVNTEPGDESITARRFEIANFADRLSANRLIDELLAGRADLARAKLEKFLEHDLALYGKDLDRRDPEYRESFLALAREYLSSLPGEQTGSLAQPHRLVVREILDGTPESALASCLFAYRRFHVSVPLAERDGGWWWPHRPGSTSPDHDLTELVARRARQGRHIRTVEARAARLDGNRLRLACRVVDGDASLRPFARVTAFLLDRESGSVLASESRRMGRAGDLTVSLQLPGKDAAASTGPYDVKLRFGGRFRPVRASARAYPVEVASSLDVDVMAPAPGGLVCYRTRNGNLSLRPAPHGAPA